MAEITAAAVKELRDRSGAGMMDCKKALTEAGGDIEAATDWLRAKGLAAAQKKSSRTAAEGLVGVAVAGTKGVAVEVNSETDFVAKNDQFQDFVRTVSAIALETGAADAETLSAAGYPSGGTVAEKLVANIATIGENQTIRRIGAVSVEQGVVVDYIHNAMGAGLGKIGVLVALKSSGDAGKLAALGRQLAMHVAGTPFPPLAMKPEQLDSAVVEREKSIFADQARQSGKPENIIAKMVDGRMRKFYEEVVLPMQPFIMDPDKTVEAVVKAAEKDVGAPISIEGFVRYALGEGIQKVETDFAAEVAAAAKS